MKFNLKNRPKGDIGASDFKQWFEGFEKELREIQRKESWLYAEYLIRQILGE